MTDCVFCEIVAGTREAHVVFRNEHAVAFLDMRPVFPGHTLVVPPAHVVTLPDLPADLVQPVFTTVQRVATAVGEGAAAVQSLHEVLAFQNSLSANP